MSAMSRAYLERQYMENDREFAHKNYGHPNTVYQQCLDALIANGFGAGEAANVAKAMIRIHKNDAPAYAAERYPN